MLRPGVWLQRLDAEAKLHMVSLNFSTDLFIPLSKCSQHLTRLHLLGQGEQGWPEGERERQTQRKRERWLTPQVAALTGTELIQCWESGAFTVCHSNARVQGLSSATTFLEY